MNEQPTAAPSTRPTDMRASIACACDADEATVIANIDNARGGKLTPLRALITVDDCRRWYEQSPRDELPAATPYPWETGR